jgi:hypothetical protein
VAKSLIRPRCVRLLVWANAGSLVALASSITGGETARQRADRWSQPVRRSPTTGLASCRAGG